MLVAGLRKKEILNLNQLLYPSLILEIDHMEHPMLHQHY